MDKDRVDKLVEAAGKEDRARIGVLNKAVWTCLNAYKQDSSVANLKSWRAAEREFDAMAEELWKRYFPDEAGFENILQVVDYLSNAGWKIKKSTAYNHKKQGKLRPDAAGRFPKKDVDAYAAVNLERIDGTSQDLDAYQVEKAKAELEKLKAQARHWDTKTKIELELYVPREQFEHELAARARVFKSDLENFFRAEAQVITELVEGNKDKIPDLIDLMIERIEIFLGRYSQNKKWTVKKEPERLNGSETN